MGPLQAALEPVVTGYSERACRCLRASPRLGPAQEKRSSRAGEASAQGKARQGKARQAEAGLLHVLIRLENDVLVDAVLLDPIGRQVQPETDLSSYRVPLRYESPSSRVHAPWRASTCSYAQVSLASREITPPAQSSFSRASGVGRLAPCANRRRVVPAGRALYADSRKPASFVRGRCIHSTCAWVCEMSPLVAARCRHPHAWMCAAFAPCQSARGRAIGKSLARLTAVPQARGRRS